MQPSTDCRPTIFFFICDHSDCEIHLEYLYEVNFDVFLIIVIERPISVFLEFSLNIKTIFIHQK